MLVEQYLENIPFENVLIVHNGFTVGDRFSVQFYGARVIKYTRRPFEISILYI
jgi:hypothetical protein